MATATFTHEWYLHLLPIGRLETLDAARTRTLENAAKALDGTVLEAGEVLSVRAALGSQGISAGEVPDRFTGALFELALRTGCRLVAHHAPVEPLPSADGRSFPCAATLAGGSDLAFAPMEGPVRVGAGFQGGVLRLTVQATAPATVRTRLEQAADRILEPRVCEKRVRRMLLDATTERPLGFDELTVRRIRLPRTFRPLRTAA